MNYEKEIEILLNKLPHKLQVKYALACAESVFHLVGDKDKDAVRKSLDTTALWLVDKATPDEVYASAITYAAYVTYAAYAATASASAHAAASAYAAAHAATSAISATYAATSASYAKKDMKHYYEELIQMIKDLTELDKLIYDLTDKDLI